jgi:hypothetical protein
MHFATLAVPILKHLAVRDATMSHKEFGQAIGLVRQAWRPGHDRQVATVLQVLETVFDCLEAPRLELHRVTNATHRREGHWYNKQWVATQ